MWQSSVSMKMLRCLGRMDLGEWCQCDLEHWNRLGAYMMQDPLLVASARRNLDQEDIFADDPQVMGQQNHFRTVSAASSVLLRAIPCRRKEARRHV